MINCKFINLNGKLFNAMYIISTGTISNDIEKEYIIRVNFINGGYMDVYYDSEFKRDDEYNRIMHELTNN